MDIPAQPSAKPAALLPKWRFLRIYATGFRILLSYAAIHLLGFLGGATRKRARMPEVHRRNALRLARMMGRVKGLYIKVGQMLSIMSNFLPEDFREELACMQDHAPLSPLDQLESLMHSQLSESALARIDFFDPNPIASASLAQVHKARLKNGQQVAIKIQHPHIAAVAEKDLATMRFFVRVAGWVTGLEGLDFAYQQVRAMVQEELDFQVEAQNIQAVAAGFASDPEIVFPKVERDLSGPKILTTHFIEGVKISDAQAIRDLGQDPKQIARKMLDAYCRMVFLHGVYHADPHPGNVLVLAEGRLAFLDFGAIAHLSSGMRLGIPKFLAAAVRSDRQAILSSLDEMGFVARTADPELADRLIGYFQKRFLEKVPLDSFNLKDIKGDVSIKVEIMNDLKDLDISMRDFMGLLQVPKEWVLLHRTLLLLVGLATHLDPDLKPMEILKPYIQEALLGKGKDWKDFMLGLFKDLILSAISLPTDIRRVLTRMEAGELQYRIEGYDKRTRQFYALGQQFLFAGLTAGFGFITHSVWQGDPSPIAWVAAALTVLSALGFLKALTK
ncbi:MAG: AarF/ABC1/UbiB kinase family protein [Acidobacteria bacterium]|nr:AarF/ABC1/UbiB kinase family protein [Acidobacteriota bacterium]MCB9397999.1 AarF/ABC1/UbiB kinase family protein [Acidobacteriota bacterium]